MSDMLERPGVSGETDGVIDDFVGYDNLDLDAVLASLAEDKTSFNELPYGMPFSPYDEPKTIAHKKVLTDGVEAKTPLSNFRGHVARELQTHGIAESTAEDATVILSELVGNVRLHGSMPNEKYSGECRVFALRQQAVNDLGEAVTRVVATIQAVNFAPAPRSSEQEEERGIFEGGNGLELVNRLAKDNNGSIGRYRVVGDALGHEAFLPEEVNCGRFVVWASVATELPAEADENPTLSEG